MAVVKFPELSVNIDFGDNQSLDFTKKTGLQSLRLARTFTADKVKPAYGIISQESVVELFDFYTEVEDFIELGLLNTKSKIDINFQDNHLGRMTSDTWSETGTKSYKLSLNDELLEWQNRIYTKSKEPYIPYSALSLLNRLINLNLNLEFIVDTTTSAHLSDININICIIETSTEWELWQKLCDLGQLYVFLNNDGKVVVISQKRINLLKVMYSTNPIIIPYSYIVETPIIDKLTNNKIDKVIVSEFLVTEELSEIVNESFVVQDDNNEWILMNSTNKDAEISEKDGQSRLRFIKKVKDDSCYMKYRDVQGFQSLTIFRENRDRTNNLSLSPINGIPILNKSKEEFNFDEELGSRYILWKDTDVNSVCYAVSELLQHKSFDYRFQFIIKAYKYFFNKRDLSFGNGAKEYKIPSNEFITNKTFFGSENPIPIAEYNANQILENFTGKQTISFRIAVADLKYKNGEYAYQIKNGEVLKELDFIQLRNSKGELEPKIWQITRTELEYKGAKFMNVEGVEI